jgi:hypothetical protein
LLFRPASTFAAALSLSPDSGGGTQIAAIPPGGLGFIGGGVTSTHIDLNGTAPAVSGAFNVEVFTSMGNDTLAAGYDVGVTAAGGVLDSGVLRGAVQLSAGDYEVLDTAATTAAGGAVIEPRGTSIRLGSGNQTVVGAAADSVSAGTGAQMVNALAGNMLVVGSTGALTVFGGVSDTITAGFGPAYIDGSTGSMAVTVGLGGTDTIFAGHDTTVSGGSAAALINLGSGGIVNLNRTNGNSTPVGDAMINATIGGAQISLGIGAATVFGGVGDTITGQGNAFGSSAQYIDGQRGGALINVGSGGVETVFGSTVAGSGNTITGGRATLIYTGGSGDLIANGTGSAIINAISGGPGLPANETIAAGSGPTSVWGGAGDRIGVGGAASASGAHLWGHSTTAPGAVIGFGSNDSVAATTYDTLGGSALVNSTVAGASTSQVTIGGAAGTFDTLHDYLFYPNQTSGTDAAIVATAQSVNGGTSTAVTLPDGTVMTLLGVTQAQLTTALAAGTLFKP